MSGEGDTLQHPGVIPEKQMGAFRLREILGGGGMGLVFRAEDAAGRPAAVKVLRAHLADEHGIRRFRREAAIRVEHPNVVRVLDAGTATDGTPFIAFELLEGESLAERLRRGVLSPAEAVDLGGQACAGLAAAHAAGIVHRDLKPANLFLCRDGTLKVLDFGIAHLASGETQLTAAGSVLGTPVYLAPEQARGQPDRDPRIDVWALGTVLYEAVSGAAPFARDSPLATMLAILVDDLPPLFARRPEVAPGLAAVIERALQKERARRWPDIGAFGAALARADLTSPAPRTGSNLVTAVITAGEQRVVALLLAQGVRELAPLEREVSAAAGTLLPLAGGAAIAIFGGSRWEGDEIERACAAALRARAAAERIAVASGRASQAAGGVSGEAVQAAERGCARGLRGVAADARVLGQLSVRFAVRDAGAGVVEVTGFRGSEHPAPSVSERSEAPLLGRRTEVAQLDAALETVLGERRAMAVIVTGPPGIGKTRLRRELEARIGRIDERLVCLHGRGDLRRREHAFSLFGDIVRGRLREVAPEVRRSVPPDVRERALMALVDAAAGDETGRDHAQFLGQLAGIALPETVALRAARGDPQLMADRLRLAVHAFFRSLCERLPVIVLLDDLHHADAQSVELLQEVFDRFAEMPVLLFGAGRPELFERHPRLLATGDVLRLGLRGLKRDDVGRLAARVAGGELGRALVDAVAERTAGNPLFVEQIVLALADGEVIGAEVSQLPLPLTVEAAVQSRLDLLPPAEKDLCKRGSVYGRAFTAREIEALGIEAADELLRSLVRKDLLAVARRSPEGDPTFAFQSALVAEVAYRMLADEVRRELHLTAARHLDTVPESHPEEVARNYEAAGERATAGARYAAAALTAARAGDSPTVVRCSDRALELGVPDGDRYALRMARADALRFLGRRDLQRPELDAALECALTDADRARALVERAVLALRTGRLDEAVAGAAAAVDAARRAGDPDTLVLALVRRAQAAVHTGTLDEASGLLDEADGVEGRVLPSQRALAWTVRGEIAAMRHDLAARMAAHRESARRYLEAGDLRRVASAEANLADVLNRLGAYGDAERELRAAIDRARRLGYRLQEGYCAVNLAYSLLEQGRLDEARGQVDGALAIAEGANDPHLRVTALVYGLAVRSRSGADPALRAECDRVVREAASSDHPALKAIALSVAARAFLGLGDVGRALEASAAAMDLRDGLGGLEEGEADLFAVRAAALAASGDRVAAEAVRERGRERISAIAAAIGDKRLRASFLDRDPHRELGVAT